MFGRKLTIVAALVLAIGITVAGVRAQTIIHVDDDASAGGDGTTWSKAFDELQDALAVANTGDEVHVAGGTYTPSPCEPPPCSYSSTSPERGDTFQLINGVELMGGYRGCPGANCGGGDPDERDIAAYKTVLSGDLNGDDASMACTTDAQCSDYGKRCIDSFCLIHGNRSENSYHVVTGSGTDATAVLDGFTITAGNASQDAPGGNGGGMFNYAGSPTVANCTFERNTCRNCGGGMCNHNASSPIVVNCRFVGNYAPDCGGGQANYTSCNATLINCVFIGNVAGDDGGGMRAGAASPMLVNCLFSGNHAGEAVAGGVTAGAAWIWGPVPRHSFLTASLVTTQRVIQEVVY